MGKEKKRSSRTGNFRLAVLTILLAFSLSGVGFISSPAKAGEPSSMVLDGIRPDLRELIYALSYRVQGLEFDAAGAVAFDEAIGSLVDPTGVSYQYWNLRHVAIISIEELGNNKFRLFFLMQFSDVMKRQSVVQVGVHYTSRNGAVFVEHALVEPFYSEQSDMQVLMAPSDALPEFSEFQAQSLEEVYLAMLEQGSAASALIEADDRENVRMTLLVIERVRDRPDTLLDVVMRNDAEPELHFVTQRNQNGWAYLLVDGDFSVGDGGAYEIFRIKSEARGGDATSLGQFAINKQSAN